MSRSNIVLMAIAAVQVVVLVVMGASDSGYVQEGARVDGGFRPLKDLAKGSVTEISISNGDGDHVVATLA